jgi:two-component system, chemotaxis family, sensor kinase CheA
MAAVLDPSQDGVAGDLFADFLLEARERLGRLESLLLAAAEVGSASEEVLEEVRLQLHTLKGNAGIVGLTPLQSLAHELEDLAVGSDAEAVEELLHGVDRFREMLQNAEDGRSPGAAQGSVRVPFSTLDALMALLGEMVIYRNRVTDALAACQRQGPSRNSETWDEVQRAYELLGGTLDHLRDGVTRLRMVPVSTIFRPLARIVHDEAAGAGKEVRFEFSGGDTTLDKALLELASEALGHLVRNAVVHGLETPEERRHAGKEEALLRLTARADAREVILDVLDDGRGIIRDGVLAEAARRGLRAAAGEDPLALLFLPGFSTRHSANLSSGRGVGLAAVKEVVERRGGRVEVFTEEGVGALFRLRLPLSVSITRALLLSGDGEDYVLPLNAVVESVELTPARVHEINGALVLSWRGGLIPLLDLGYCFGTSAQRRRTGYAVVIESGESQRGIAVEKIHGIREVVVRGLDAIAGSPDGVAGSTIMGDGRAVLILDPVGLIQLSPFGRARGRAA